MSERIGKMPKVSLIKGGTGEGGNREVGKDAKGFSTASLTGMRVELP